MSPSRNLINPLLTWSGIDFTKTVTIYPGPKSEKDACKFEVPYDFIIPRSTKALRAQTSSKDIELLGTSAKDFSTYLLLLFTGKIVVREVGAQEDMDEVWERLIELYLVAVGMEDAESVNQAVDEMWKMLQEHGMNELLTSYLFTRTGMLKAHQMLIDYIVESEDESSRFAKWLYGERDSDYLDENERQHILSEVTKEFMRRRGEGRAPGGVSKAGAARYHI